MNSAVLAITVRAWERFLVRTVYRHVRAPNAKWAEHLAQHSGESDHFEIQYGGDEWVDTESVEQEHDDS